MEYNVINALAIIIGSALGLLFRHYLSVNLTNHLIKAISLCIIYVGVLGLSQGGRVMLVIISIILGTLLGTIFKLDDRINGIAKKVEAPNKKESPGIAEGFANASILFCAGAMGVVGSLEAGISNSGTTLTAKALLDGITAGLMTTTLGIGVMLSSVSVFLYQAVFILLAQTIAPLVTPTISTDLSVIGGIIIMAIGFNMCFNTQIKVANMIPATFIPIILSLFGFK